MCDSSVALVASNVECEHSSIPDLVWGNSPLGIWDIQNWSKNLSKLKFMSSDHLREFGVLQTTPQLGSWLLTDVQRNGIRHSESDGYFFAGRNVDECGTISRGAETGKDP